jgi:hypothetical protein
MAKTTEELEKELEDARELFTFAKTQAAYGDKELPRIAVKVAIYVAGEDYVKIAEGCGWTREELNDLLKIKPVPAL